MNKLGKILIMSIVILMVISTMGVFAGGEKEAAGDDKVKVVLYVNGTLGDKSYFDSAARGIDKAVKELGIFGKVVEGGYDPARWEPDILQLAEGDWDIIIAGSWQLQEYLEKIAPNHQDKNFFTYDTSVTYANGGLDNVYSMLYSQNEASFLTGALAAMITSSDLPLANSEKVVGFLGGMDITVINDFKVGFEEGVAYIDPDVKILVAYAGAFSDPAKGKELTLAMFDQGADITFNVAGETGLGGIDAAKDRSLYTLGVDSDQYLLFAETDPKKASFIVSSMMKNVDFTIFRAIEKHIAGTLKYGEAEVLGIEKGGVGLADNENYKKLVPSSMRDKIDEISKMIVSGEIKVGTAFGQ
ncbi:MAG: BMP family ABC transporter substrate-binding protein [Spirochaetia bacterium]|jgi:basic membrane protein A|nr:BMP family ABC transporter substrate-binding protein [Spirochaetia bacterium]